MGAGPRVIGVGDFDRYPPEAETRTEVGGLIDPDVERIISLKPDLVVVYGTQTDLRAQLERAGIPMFPYQHAGLADITATIRALGTRVGSGKEAQALADRIEAEIADVRKRVSGRPRPRTLLVFGRDAETLRGIYASGAVGFLHDMLEAAGGTNVFADIKRQSVQTTSELAVARAPEVIVEIGVDTASTKGRNVSAWDASGIDSCRAKQADLSAPRRRHDEPWAADFRLDPAHGGSPPPGGVHMGSPPALVTGGRPIMKTLVSWSSGKDSAWMLHVLRQDRSIEVGGLLTTMNEEADRVAMHAVRRRLLEAQADAAGLPMRTCRYPGRGGNEQYKDADALGFRRGGGRRFHARGVRRSVSRGRPEVS